ncbi:MAG: TIGR03086 family metal-binding protein [Nocardioidaceae bacterium]
MSYTRTVTLPVTPDEAFILVTDPERLRRWQTVSARVDLRAGGDFRWTVTPGHVAAGTYREVEPGRRVVFGWGWEGSTDLPPDTSTVTVTVEPTAGGTLLTLRHDGLTPEQATMHALGWDHYLTRLGQVAATGDAGPDEWAAAPQELDVLSSAEATLAALQRVLRNLTTEDRTRQTPCDDFDGHALSEHLVDSLVTLGAMAGATVVDPGTGSLENRVAVMAGQALEAWRVRGVDGAVPTPGGGEMPAAAAAGILSLEFLLHGWDFAQTSGQELVVSDEVVTYVQTVADPIVPSGRDRGSFGVEVPPADDAGPLERLVAFSGRTPLTL